MKHRGLAVLAAGALALACDARSNLPPLEPELVPSEARGAPPPAMSWALECQGCNINGIHGRSADDVYAMGSPGGTPTVYHYDGATWSVLWQWTPQDPFFGIDEPDLRGIWIGPTGLLYTSYFIGPDTYVFDGTQWSVADDNDFFFFALGGTDDLLFQTGEFGTITRFDGTDWDAWWGLTMPPTYPEEGYPDDLFWAWGTGDQIFAVGATAFVHFPCSGGNYGSVLQYDGATWKTWIRSQDELIPAMSGVWGSSPTNVFAVGGQGTILRFNGRGWARQNSGTTAYLCAVWGSAANNVYAVGGTALRFDGSAWSPVDTGTSQGFRAIWGFPDGEVFLAGTSIVHGTPASP